MYLLANQVSFAKRPRLIGLGLILVGFVLTGAGCSGGCGSHYPSDPRLAVMVNSDGAQYLTHEIIVRRAAGVSQAEFQAALGELGGQVVDQQDVLSLELGFSRVLLPGNTTADEAISELKLLGLAQDAERNYLVEAVQVPSDPMYGQLWGMKKIQAEEAWELTTGSEAILVAVSDTGVDRNHSDLAANMWNNPNEIPGNGIDDDNNGYVDDVHGWDFANNDNNPMDDHGHGTHVSGTIGACANDGIGVAGLNWNTRIVAIKFLSSSGSGSLWNGAQTILYASKIGAQVLNASWGCEGCYVQYMHDAIEEYNASGGLFVAAAGNNAANVEERPFYPAGHTNDNVVSVAATQSDEQLASFSNYGEFSVHLAAPGHQILSTLPGNNYQSWSGTSMAAPHVAGAAALYLALGQAGDPISLKERLISTCDPHAALSGKVVSNGRLNVLKLLALDSQAPQTPQHPEAQSGVAGDITLRWDAVEDEDLAMYRIDWGNTSGQYTQHQKVSAPTTQVTLTNLPHDERQYFVVYAIDHAGNYSTPSEEVWATPHDATPPPQVIDLVAAAAPGPLASGQVIAASSEVSTYYQAENAFDGSVNTSWISMPTSADEPAYLVIELDQPTLVDHIKLWPVRAYPEFFPIDFDLDASLDGSHWTHIGGGRNSQVLALDYVEVRFGAQEISLLRLRVHKSFLHSSGNHYAGIGEIGVYQISETPDALGLTFSAPGDDPGLGTSSYYDIRYSTQPIDESNFAQATAIDPPLPSASGVLQTLSVSDLWPETVYYFAMVAVDDAGNTSPLSNLASASTLLVPPATITDLAVDQVAEGQVGLSWTAVGDNGHVGQASGYDLRYLDSPINPGNFTDAIPVAQLPLPAPAGSHEQLVVSGLDPQTLYYFAIRATDASGAHGGLSNVVSAKAQSGADTIPPATVDNLAIFESLNQRKVQLSLLDHSSDRDDYYSAANMLDGNITSLWLSDRGDHQQEEWATFDLGQIEALHRFRMHPASYGNMQQYYPQAIDIQASTDGINWTTVVHVEGLAATMGEYDEWALPVMPARFVKLLIKRRGPASCDSHYGCIYPSWVAISEFEAWALTPAYEATLSWVAPGDDDWQGMASAYYLKQSNQPITEQTFAQAQDVATQAPLPGGMLEVVELPALELERDYYFALKATDEAGNLSDLSNLVALRTPAVPPAPVTDLMAIESSLTSIDLSWTATGDDGHQGQATQYDLRYSKEPLSIHNWYLATPVVDAPVPSHPSTLEHHTVSGLDSNTLYYFGVRAIDDRANASLLSNIASIETRDGIPPNHVYDLVASRVNPDQADATTIEVSDSTSRYSDLTSAENLVDQAPTTIWMSAGTKPFETQQIQFALQQPIRLGKLRLLGAASYLDLFPANFEIQVQATPDASWVTVIAEQDFSTSGDWEEWQLGVVQAQNIKLIITRAGTWGDQDYAALSQFEVYEDPTDYTSIQLAWTAPGDDGPDGTSSDYDMRIADHAIEDDPAFDLAQTLLDEPTPQASGMLERMLVRDLEPNTQYCFALKASDDQGHSSALSNSPCATTPGIPPGTITDLRVVDITKGSVSLGWTATGADGTQGQASRYSLRYSTQRINSLNWDQAQKVGQLASPQPAGSPEFAQVHGLTGITLYYFAIRAIDQAQNQSPISNNTSARTADDIPPERITDLTVHTSNQQGSLTLQFTAPSDSGMQGQAAAYDLRLSTQPLTELNFHLAQQALTPEPHAADYTEIVAVADLLPESLYYAAVKAVDADGNWSQISNIVSERTADMAPGQVSDLRVVSAWVESNGQVSLEVQWTAPGDDADQGMAHHYDLRWANTPISESNFGQATHISAPNPEQAGSLQSVVIFGLEQCATYYLAIKTVDERDNLSLLSNVPVTETPDETAPEQVMDLNAVTGSEEGSLQLSWTSPDDTCRQGAVSFDLRWATEPIHASNFDQATPFIHNPDPAPSGQRIDFLAVGLPPETPVYVALVAQDDSSNRSACSNSPSAWTPDKAPAAIADLVQTDQTTTSVRVSWTAVGDDGLEGQATACDLRYSPEMINSTNFNGAQAVNCPEPGQPGETHSLTIEGLESISTIYVAIKTVDDRGNWSGLSNVLRAELIDNDPPAQINDLAATTGSQAGTILLAWTAVGDDGNLGQATSYHLRHFDQPIHNGNWDQATPVSDLLAPAVAGSSEGFLVPNLQGERIYHFAVRALDELGNSGDLSASVSAQSPAIPPSAISDLVATAQSATQIELRWTAPGDDEQQGTATHYDIRYSTSVIDDNNFDSASVIAAPAPLEAGSTQQLTLSNLEESTQYWFAIKTSDDVGAQSDLSNVAQSMTHDETAPGQITNLIAATGAQASTIRLSWTATGDDGQQGTADQVQLRRASSPIDNSNWEQAVVVTGLPSPAAAGTQQECVVTDLQGETTYHFAMRAIDEAHNVGALSESVSADSPAIAPQAIADLSATAQPDKTVALSWTAPGDDGDQGTAVQYEIRYATDPITEETFASASQVSNPPLPQEAGSSQSLSLTDLTESTTYWFAIKTSDDVGAQSALSNVAQITTLDETAPGQTEDLTAQTGSEANTIQLTWTASGDDGQQGTADHYQLRYAQSPIDQNNWDQATPVKGLPQPSQAGDQQDMVVTNLQGETTYHFALRAVDEADNAGVLSASVSADSPPVAPAAITDLAASALLNRTMSLSWTAPGDDGFQGTASRYEIRYSNEEITAESFDQATQVPNPVLPTEAGTSQSMEISGLTESTIYWFAIKTHDDVGAISDCSNIASSTTLDETSPGMPGAFSVTIPQAGDLRLTPVSARASSQVYETLDATQAIDADEETAWVSAGTQQPDSQTLTLDLGQAFDLDRIRLLPSAQYRDLFPRAFTLQVSENGSEYTAVVSETDFLANGEGFLSWGFAPVQARFVRLVTSQPAKSFFGLHYTVIAEMEVYKASTQAGQARLSWLAPGDDGHQGTATEYEIYLHTQVFDETSLDQTTQLSSPPSPQAAGNLQSTLVTALLGEQAYYFAMRAIDESNNIGPLTSVLAVTTSAVPPAPIQDLSLIEVDLSWAEVSWTAPGDDGQEGTADSYEMRYAPWSITIENFHLATSVQNMPTPKPAGTPETLRIDNLEPGTTYRLALLARDDSGSTSYLSNILIVHTQPEPDHTPPAAIADLSAELPPVGNEPLPAEVMTWSSEQAPNFRANNLSDGTYDSAWSTAAFDQSQPERVTVDLGQTIAAELVRIWPDRDFLNLFPLAFEVRISPDGLSWTTAMSWEHGTLEANQPLEGQFPASPVRYVEFVAAELAPWENGYYYAVVAEIEVFGVQSEPGTVLAAWTATGDDNELGQATAYDLRIGSCPYDHQAALPVTTSTPQESGQHESIRINDLAAGTYCLGLVVTDEADNASQLSNIVQVTVEQEASYCGDGIIDQDEQCDDGSNDGSYAGCMPDCQEYGPHCGDGNCSHEETLDSCADDCQADLVVVVEPAMMEALHDSLQQYLNDLADAGHKAQVVAFESSTVAQLRSLLQTQHSRHGISGAFLVGNLPTAWYEQTAFGSFEQFPIDLYLMDLDAEWLDANNNQVLDGHSPLELDIFVSRIIGSQTEIAAYFAKAHAYRSQGPNTQISAWIFKDDDWKDFYPGFKWALDTIYATVESTEDAHATTRAAYVEKLSGSGQGVEFVYQWIHSWPQELVIEGTGGGRVSVFHIDQDNYKGAFYNLFDCSAARFTEINLGMTYLTQTDTGLAIIGSTKTGGIYTPALFHSQLGFGQTWGEAYRHWYNGNGKLDDEWYLGMVILGDPMLQLVSAGAKRPPLPYLAPEAPWTREQIDQLTHTMQRNATQRNLESFSDYRANNPSFFPN